MVVTSPFPRRTRSRPMLAAQSVQQVWREVRSEDELIQALTPTNVTDIASLAAISLGRRIVIAAPITLTRPIVIAPTLIGTTIESHGHIPIWCGKDSITAFVVRAPLCTFRGLLFFALDQGGGAPRFGTVFGLEGGANQTRILDVHALGCDQLVEGAADVDGVHVRGCDASTPSGRIGDCVTFDGAKWKIMGNLLSGSGAGVAVRSGTSGERASIVGNSCDGTGITTSAGTGSNTIAANTDAGTVTAHGSDDTIGGNT